MVALVIAFPGLVTGTLDHRKAVDLDKVQIVVPEDDQSYKPDAPPDFGAPAAGGQAASAPPSAASSAQEDANDIMRALQAAPHAASAAKP
jgi:hypothetical protein